MKVVIQRVKYANVVVDKKEVGKINEGLLVLVGFTYNENIESIKKMASKIVNLRIFDDENHVMNKSILDTNGSILSISQFTLQAKTKDGNRPSYIEAMKGEDASNLYELFNKKLNDYVPTYPGVFGADMEVNIVNDGPVTIIIDSKER